MARWIPLALFLVALTGVARADEPPVRVLTVGVGALPPPPAEQAGLRAAEVLGQRPIVVEGPLLAVLELHDPIFIPGVQTVPCDGRSVRVDQVVGGLESARRAVDELEYGSARLLLEGGVELLPCLVDVVEPALLYDLHFLSGLVAWNEGDRDQAEASFARAVSVDPARPWDEAYAPDAKGAFLQALQSSIAEPGPILRVSDDLRGRVLLDGRLVADGDHLAAGPHLLQVSTGPTWVSQELQVEPARVRSELALLGPRGLQEALLAGEPTLTGLLGTAAEARGMQRLLLVGADGDVEFDVVGRTFGASGAAAPIVTSSSGRSGPASPVVGGLVLAGAGAAVGGLGFALHGSAWQQGSPWIDDPGYGDAEAFETLRRQNQVGFAVGVGGLAVLATGVVVTVTAAVQGPDVKAVLAPVGVVGPDGAVLGVAGRF